jgi:hypothetical protein
MQALAAELRALGRELAVPPAADPAAAVRQRLTGPAARRRAVLRAWHRRGWQLGWRAALVAVAVVLAVLIATPQGRAVISHVLRFAGVELRQQPGPAISPGTSGSLPGQHRVPLAQARRDVSFPILVPAALGPPEEVVVSDRGRVATLVYRRTPHGQLRLDEFAGHLDQVYFEKFVRFGGATEVRVNGARGLWLRGPHELVYVTRDGAPAAASARLTTGNTLIWGTGRVALRLEGSVGRKTALAIASSAR